MGDEAAVKGERKCCFKALSGLKEKWICLEEQKHRAVWKPKEQNRSEGRFQGKGIHFLEQGLKDSETREQTGCFLSKEECLLLPQGRM